jgi:hypothetical protein
VFERTDVASQVPDALCMDDTYSPLYLTDPAATAAGFKAWSGTPMLVGTTPANAGAYVYATLEHYTDAAGKINPYLVMDLTSTTTTLIYNILRQNPGNVLCIEELPSITELTGTDYLVKGHMHTEGEGDAVRSNPHFTMPDPFKVKVDSSDTPAFLEDQLSDDGTWILVEKATNIMKVSHRGPGGECYTGGTIDCTCTHTNYISLDQWGHVRYVQIYNVGTASFAYRGPLAPA